MPQYIIALDQGTTSSRAILFNEKGEIVNSNAQEFAQIYPQPGWVEHDPMEIWRTQRETLMHVLEGIDVHDVAALGITNQRETALVWEKDTGKPIYNAIVWQCRRTAALCEKLKEDGMEGTIRDKTGLVADAYFAGTKLKWILDHVEGARSRAQKGELLCGTVDTWLIWQLTGGRSHVTDYTNASRTMLFNIHTLDWDTELLDMLDIPRAMLPKVVPSSGIAAMTDIELLGVSLPIAGIAGDQQAALFGQCCYRDGMAKNTYGTGGFLLMHTGARAVMSRNNLLTTIACSGPFCKNKVEYALEGSIFVAGAAVQWLRDELKLIARASETEALANSVSDTAGVVLVPAFTGLGAPYWDMYARGTIVGLTRGAGKAHIVRATLESIAYQTRDVLEAMREDSGLALAELKVDGGASANAFLMQFQSDILNAEVSRPVVTETTALGAAYLAGLAVGIWTSREEIAAQWQEGQRFVPAIAEQERGALYRRWKRAVERSRAWADE